MKMRCPTANQGMHSNLFVSPPPQGGDSDDDAEAFTGSDDTQASGIPPPHDSEGISTYGEEDLVPEPHRVSSPRAQCRVQSMWISAGSSTLLEGL